MAKADRESNLPWSAPGSLGWTVASRHAWRGSVGRAQLDGPLAARWTAIYERHMGFADRMLMRAESGDGTPGRKWPVVVARRRRRSPFEDDEIIFGIEDGATIKPQHVFLRTAYNQGFKAINVIDNLKNLKELYIIGHSFGETDHMYFKDFFAKQSYEHYYGKGKKITLYHYGHDGYNQLFMQLDDLTDNHLSLFKRNNDFKTIDTSK